jgi:hypothetical protein
LPPKFDGLLEEGPVDIPVILTIKKEGPLAEALYPRVAGMEN